MTEDEFLRIYDEHLPRLLGFCAFRLGSRQDAEDVVAETFARLLTHGGPSAPEKIPAWLFVVARNLCADHDRRARHTGAMPDGSPEPSAEPVWTDFIVRDALHPLNATQQQVVYLRAIEDLTFADIARLLGRSEMAVKMQYHRAMKRVRRELEEVEACSRSKTETV
jgi:RNA polymerase sigma-70 factor, ECF subfamily